MERWANPSSPHAEGRAAHAALEDARARIKRALGWTGGLIFTSGAREGLGVAPRKNPPPPAAQPPRAPAAASPASPARPPPPPPPPPPPGCSRTGPCRGTRSTRP